MNILRKYRQVRKMLKKSTNVFIMSHKNLDLDAIGSALALYNLVEQMNKNAFIILNDKKHEAGVAKVLSYVDRQVTFLNSNEILPLLTEKDLLIIVDVN